MQTVITAKFLGAERGTELYEKGGRARRERKRESWRGSYVHLIRVVDLFSYAYTLYFPPTRCSRLIGTSRDIDTISSIYQGGKGFTISRMCVHPQINWFSRPRFSSRLERRKQNGAAKRRHKMSANVEQRHRDFLPATLYSFDDGTEPFVHSARIPGPSPAVRTSRPPLGALKGSCLRARVKYRQRSITSATFRNRSIGRAREREWRRSASLFTPDWIRDIGRKWWNALTDEGGLLKVRHFVRWCC